MKKQKILFFCLAAAFMSITAGCDAKEVFQTALSEMSSEQTASEETVSEEVSSEEELTKTQALKEQEDAAIASELYNTYIEVNNTMVGRFGDVLTSYFKYVEVQEEFVLLDEDYWCLSNISTFYESMDRAYELANQKTQKDELDEAYLELYPVMRELSSTLDEVYQYTDLKSYVDDDYAKGKEYHAIIWKDYTQYETLSAAFIEQLSSVAYEKRMEDMQSLKEAGYEGTYSVMKLITTAQEIQDAIYAQGIDDSRLIELDIEALQPLYDQYVEEVQICLEYLADENAMAEEGFPTNSSYYSFFEDAVGKSKLALTELFQRVEKQDPVDEFYLDSYFPDDGTIANFDDTVSDIISNYNSMLGY